MTTKSDYVVTSVAGAFPSIAGVIRQVGSTIALTIAEAENELRRGTVSPVAPVVTGPRLIAQGGLYVAHGAPPSNFFAVGTCIDLDTSSVYVSDGGGRWFLISTGSAGVDTGTLALALSLDHLIF